MGAQARIAELSQRHRSLEETIEHEAASPSGDDLKIAALKKEKLRIKDEISRLRLVS